MPTYEFEFEHDRFHSVFDVIVLYFKKIWDSIPSVFRILVVIVLFVSCINIIVALVKACINNKSTWKKKTNTELMYSFFAGSGQYQRSHIYKDAHKLLFDKKWSLFSFAGLAYRVGNIENTSKVLVFSLTIVYLILAILGMTEMVIRSLLGVFVYFVINIAYFVLLMVVAIINLLLTPLLNLVDKSMWIDQHCPQCYATFKLPTFECSHCGTHHTKLYPGNSGLLFAKCSCGHFIPCASLSRRKQLKAYCPKCDFDLPASSIKAFTVQIIGGNSTGKTALVSAFQHRYIESITKLGYNNVLTYPDNDFHELEKMYHSGITERSSSDEISAYYIIRDNKSYYDDAVVIYDAPDELILGEQYEKNPLFFSYNDGIIIIVDPLSVSSVRHECEIKVNPESVSGYSDDSTEDIIVHFINKYSEITGRNSRKMSNIPIALVISKTDLHPIGSKIGMVKIKQEFASNQNQYINLEDARNRICRRYLTDIGLGNSINNLESAFSCVSYFPVSSIGHCIDGNSFNPQDVIMPFGWLAQQHHSNIKDLVSLYEEEIK